MPVQTQESKRAGMNAFLDIYEEFAVMVSNRGGIHTSSETIVLFTAYIRGKE